MRSKWTTFWELIILAIISYPALHYLGVSIHSIKSSISLDYFNAAAIIAPIIFLVIAIFAVIIGN